MKLSRVLFAALAASALTGCATVGKSTLDYQQPKMPERVHNTIVVDEPFDAEWDHLVGNLATGFFVINNIDKASRLISRP